MRLGTMLAARHAIALLLIVALTAGGVALLQEVKVTTSAAPAQAPADLEASRRESARLAGLAETGMGLLPVAGAAGVLLVLYSSYTLSQRVTQPLESTLRWLEAVTGGDLTRRLGEDRAAGSLRELAAGLNQLADSLQRATATPRRDLLLALQALDRFLEGAGEGCWGVLTPEGRLLAASESSRRLIAERGRSFQWLCDEAKRQGAAAVEEIQLLGPAGEALGSLVKLSGPAGG